MVWVKLRWLEPTRHKRGLLGGCDAHAGGETSVGAMLTLVWFGLVWLVGLSKWVLLGCGSVTV
jgi:hypothetical protein